MKLLMQMKILIIVTYCPREIAMVVAVVWCIHKNLGAHVCASTRVHGDDGSVYDVSTLEFAMFFLFYV